MEDTIAVAVCDAAMLLGSRLGEKEQTLIGKGWGLDPLSDIEEEDLDTGNVDDFKVLLEVCWNRNLIWYCDTTLLGFGKLVVGDGQPLYNTTVLT